jgi:hypothetical protein
LTTWTLYAESSDRRSRDTNVDAEGDLFGVEGDTVLFTVMATLSRVSLAMMSLMQALAKDDSPDMSAPRTALLKRLEEVAMKNWLAVMRETTG